MKIGIQNMTKDELLNQIMNKSKESNKHNCGCSCFRKVENPNKWLSNTKEKAKSDPYVAEVLSKTVEIIDEQDYKCLFDVLKVLDGQTKESIDNMCANVGISQIKKWKDLALPYWKYFEIANKYSTKE